MGDARRLVSRGFHEMKDISQCVEEHENRYTNKEEK